MAFCSAALMSKEPENDTESVRFTTLRAANDQIDWLGTLRPGDCVEVDNNEYYLLRLRDIFFLQRLFPLEDGTYRIHQGRALRSIHGQYRYGQSSGFSLG